MRLFRRIIFRAHLCTALTVGLIVLVMAVTGVLLTYERQVTWWVDTRAIDAAPTSPDQSPLSSGALLARALRANPGSTPTSVTWRAEAAAPVVVAIGNDRSVLLHAYTGVVLGEGSTGVRAFFTRVTDWHRWLGLRGDGRRLGRSITGAANLGFLFLILSGSFLWWPRNRTSKAIRSVLLFRRGLRGLRRDFNWHHVIGFWSALPLLVIVVSASVISYPWASSLLYRVAGESDQANGSPAAAEAGAPTGLSALLAPAVIPPDATDAARAAALDARAERQVPEWRAITKRVPRDAEAPVTYTIDAGTGGQPQRQARLVLDPRTGGVEEWEPFASGTRTSRVRGLLRYVHTGEAAGVAGQTLAGLVSLGTTLLVWTGFALALRRLLRWRGRHSRDARSSAT